MPVRLKILESALCIELLGSGCWPWWVRTVGRCGCGVGKGLCGIAMGSPRRGVIGIRMGKAPCGIRLSGPMGPTITPGPMAHPTTTPGASDNTPMIRHPTGANSKGGSNIGSPLPNIVLSVGVGRNSAIGGNRAMVVLRTVGVRGGVGTRGSKGIMRVGIGRKSSMLRNASLMVVRWL